MPPRPSKLDSFKPVIDEILRADLDAPRKQRHTAKRIFDRLIDEHGMRDVSYPVVRAYVADRKPQIRVEAGRGPVNVFVPQTHLPGRGGGGRLRRGRHPASRGELVTCMPVRVPAVVLRQGRAPDLRLRRVRKPSSKATSTRSPRWAGSRPARSATTT